MCINSVGEKYNRREIVIKREGGEGEIMYTPRRAERQRGSPPPPH